MFGRRPDGKTIKSLGGFFKVVPFIMPTRVDATNLVSLEIDCRAVTEFIRGKAAEGVNVSFMSVIMAAFVRAMSQDPSVNRFVVNRHIYARNHIAICFVVLKKDENGVEDETVVKVFCKPEDTVFDIAARVNEIIEQNRKTENSNNMDKFVDMLFRIPGLAGFLIGFLKMLDRWGLLPRSVIDLSPFHASLFITNMASIKMNSIFHHIYNFGTTSIFLSMGTKYKKEQIRHDNSRVVHTVMPLNVSTDERICSGAAYARCFFAFQHYMQHPEELETPPAEVKPELK